MTASYDKFIGIDIGKVEFVAFLKNDKKTKTYKNEQGGFAKFLQDYKDHLQDALVVVEATGGFERACIDFLLEHKVAVHRADTRKVKNFMRSYGQKAKTDSLDARGLAQYAHERHSNLPLFQKMDTEQDFLRTYKERRQDLNQMLVQEKNRYKSPLNKCLLSDIQVIIDCLTKQIEKIDKVINEIIDKNKVLSRKKEILTTIPGVGEITATSLLALVPELGQLNKKQIASLCGVAPFANQSGGRNKYRGTWGGRRNMRPILYMAAMGARRKKGSDLALFFERLLANGKKKLVALVAVMRKIVVIANAKIKEEFYCRKVS